MHKLPTNCLKALYWTTGIVMAALFVVYVTFNVRICKACPIYYDTNIDNVLSMAVTMSNVFGSVFILLILAMMVLSTLLIRNLRACFNNQFSSERCVLIAILAFFCFGFLLRALCDMFVVEVNKFINEQWESGIPVVLGFYLFWDFPIFLMYGFHVKNFKTPSSLPKKPKPSEKTKEKSVEERNSKER